MKKSLFTILFNPGAFFSGAMAEKEQITVPVLIVFTGGIIAAGYGYLMGGLSARMMSGAMPGIDTIIILSAVIGAFLGAFIFWLIWTVVFYALSMVFKGQGTFRRTLEFVGYGYLPQVAGMFLTLVAAFEYIPRVTVPQLTAAALQDPVALQETMKLFTHDPAMMETYPDNESYQYCVPALECQYLDFRHSAVPPGICQGCSPLCRNPRCCLCVVYDL